MSWSRTDARVRRPWVAGATAVTALVLLAPVSGWAGCPGGARAGDCVVRTRMLLGVDVPTSWHPAIWALGGLVAGAVAWLAISAVARRAARLERA